MSQFEINQLYANRYLLQKRLGCGSFSEVWMAKDTVADNIVAIKIYAPDKGMDDNGIEVFKREYSIVFNITHQNLLRPNHFDVCNDSPFLVMPFCSKGNASKYIGKMTEEEVVKFMYDVSSGLAYLHEQEPPVIHQDIKPDNILISEDGHYKLTDFGISTRIRSTLRKSVNINDDFKSAGTQAYMGPERFSRQPIPIKASDIWSLGATAFELMTGDVPFGDMGGLVLLNGAEIPAIKGNFSHELKCLIEKCLAKDTWERPTAKLISKITGNYLETQKWNVSEIINSNADSQETSSEHTKQNSKKNKPREIVDFTNSEKHPDNKERKNKKKILWIIIPIVLIVIALIIYLLIGNKNVVDTEEVAIIDSTEYIEAAVIDSIPPIIQEEVVVVEPPITEVPQHKDKSKQKSKDKADKRPEQKAATPVDSTVINDKTDKKASTDPLNIVVIYVEGGVFKMGCDAGQSADCNDDEKPSHQVEIRSFKIGKYEVTQAQWKAVMNNNPSKFQGDNLPVTNVSWNDVQEFILKLNNKTGKKYRLPTEAEWEYAAKGGQSSNVVYKYSGSNSINAVAWYSSNSDNITHPVGSKSSNVLGIYDMNGNVHEWCSDWYAMYKSNYQNNPAGSNDGTYKICRGGGAKSQALNCRNTFRSLKYKPNYQNDFIGFRLVEN